MSRFRRNGTCSRLRASNDPTAKDRGLIGIQLKGRLGNQMFQYAAARTLAEGLRCALVVAGHTLGRRFGLAGHWLGLDARQPYEGKQQNGLLHAAYGCGPGFGQARLVEIALPFLRRGCFRQSFSPSRSAVGGGTFEEFDDSVFHQGAGTWLSGWFQSERYFAANSERVHEWFRPLPEHEQALKKSMAQWPAPCERMAAIHVRRGDYALTRDNLGNENQGWLLPMNYYRDALDRIPCDAGLAVFSDDPDWAMYEFADRRPWVSRATSAVLDMFLMTRCRWVIAANSSFSWWAAWLNRREDKIVFAPRHHLGWRIGRWVPGGIEVAGWEYLDVKR